MTAYREIDNIILTPKYKHSSVSLDYSSTYDEGVYSFPRAEWNVEITYKKTDLEKVAEIVGEKKAKKVMEVLEK